LKVNDDQAKPEQPETGALTKSLAREIVETILLALILYLLINAVTVRVRVDGTSMVPTLQNNELVVIYRLAYHFGQDPQRGDIIVFDSINRPDDELIKRIIGLPGDEIVIRGGQVLVNGDPLEEAYIAAAPEYSGSWQVTEEKLFVLGDNRNVSSDSHVWGLLPLDEVVGKAIFVYWPIDEIGVINKDLVYAEDQ